MRRQGKGEYTMEYRAHEPAPAMVQVRPPAFCATHVVGGVRGVRRGMRGRAGGADEGVCGGEGEEAQERLSLSLSL
eukprot:1533103-Rhodomonas_salina.2